MKRTTTVEPIFRKNIFEAALHNDHEAVKNFVEGVPVTSINNEKQTAAHIAANNGNFNILKYLLGKDPTLVHKKDAKDQTVLHLAVKVGSRELIKFLVDDCKANMYEPCEDRYNNTPIHFAAYEGNLEAMKFFIEDKNADKNVKNGYGEPPAFSAAENSQLDIIKYLLEQGANLTIVDDNNMNILFVSATVGDVKIPRFLLDHEKLKFNIDWKDNFGDTILHRAVWNNRLEFVKYWVKFQHPNLNIIDTYDRTPLHIAAHKNNIHLVRFLVGHGTDTELEDCWHRRPIETTSNYEVIDYLHSVQGYKFTLHEHYHDPTAPPKFSQTEWVPPVPNTTTCTYNNSRTRAARRRPMEVAVRYERSVRMRDYFEEEHQPSLSMNSFWKWIHRRVTWNSVNRGDSIKESIRPVEKNVSGVNTVLFFANASVSYFRSKNQRIKHQSVLSPVEILKNKMSALAEDAVNFFSQ